MRLFNNPISHIQLEEIVLIKKKSILYFTGPGDHTDETLKAAKERADELGIRDIVVSSTEGTTALRAVDVFKGYNVVIVTHVTGYKEPGELEVSNERAKKIRDRGGQDRNGRSRVLRRQPGNKEQVRHGLSRGDYRPDAEAVQPGDEGGRRDHRDGDRCRSDRLR